MAEYTIDKFTYGGNTYKLQDNESGYLTAADVPEGASKYTSTPENIATIAATGSSNAFSPGDHVHAINSNTIINALGFTPISVDHDYQVQQNLSTHNSNLPIILRNNTTSTNSTTEPVRFTPSATVQPSTGNIITTGKVTVGVAPTDNMDLTTKQYVDGLVSGIIVPTQTSQLQNNSGFLTSAVTSLNSKTGAVTISAGNNVTVSATSNTITISATDTDTKNTAGATTTSSTIYLIGATATTTNPQTYATNDLLYDDGLYSYAHYFDDNNYYAYRTALDQSGRVISLYNNDVQNNTYNTVSVSPTSINITANNPSSSVVIESPNNGTYIHNVVTPTADADVVNKEYIDKRMNFSDTDDQVWVNWYGEEALPYGQWTRSVTYSFAVHMDDNKTKLTSATLARSYNGADWDILGTLHPTSSFSNSFVPIGTILDFAGFTPPTGYLICDGSAVSRTTYADLFEILKDENDNLPWGDGDGSTTFNLPNLCGRTAIGSGTGTASDATAHTLGSTGGAETHTLTPSETATKNHSHTYAKSKTSTDSHTLTTSEIPSHKHSVNERTSSGTSTGWAFMTENGKYAASGTRVVNTGGGGGHTHGIGTANATTTGNPTDANGNAHNNMQPYATVNKIIKAL